MQNILKAVCVIIGTIIGAGFASGKEIYIFFNNYGMKGIFGIAIASILTGIVIYKVLMQIRVIEEENYKNYLSKIKISPKIKEIFNIIINIFLLMSFYIMIAGFCAYFEQEYNIPTIIVSIIICIMCYITFMKHIEGVTRISTVLIPFLIFMIILMGIKVNRKRISSKCKFHTRKNKLVIGKFGICKLQQYFINTNVNRIKKIFI